MIREETLPTGFKGHWLVLERSVAGFAASVLICAVQHPDFKVAGFGPKVFTFWWLPRLSRGH